MPTNAISETGVDEKSAIQLISEKSLPLNTTNDLDPLLNRIGEARIVMLGEASHGTHEYYTWRSYITKRLITEKGFHFIAVEGDWPDCYNLNRYIKNYIGEKAINVVNNFNRWPTWMWANWEIISLAEWLNQYNASLARNRKIGFYGLDIYSLWESMEAIKEYLAKVDPDVLKVAEDTFNCFEPYKKDEGRSYAYASRMVPELCETEVVGLLKKIQQRLPLYNSDYENVFSTEQNALIAVNAEKYYRAMIKGGPESWNLRDSHMEETLERLLDFHGPQSKAIVWEHNTHIGDSRATDMKLDGTYNIGELVRKKYAKEEVVLVGFGSYMGTVIAGKSWGAKMQIMNMPAAKKGSWEYLVHSAGANNKLLLMDDFINGPFVDHYIGHRAIGVVYNPAREKYGNYVPSLLPLRYDAFIYLDQTKALHPLHLSVDSQQMPETYPFGV